MSLRSLQTSIRVAASLNEYPRARYILIVQEIDQIALVQIHGVDDVVSINASVLSDESSSQEIVQYFDRILSVDGTIFLGLSRTPDAEEYALKLFKLLGRIRAVRWLQLDFGGNLRESLGELPYIMFQQNKCSI